MDRRMKKTCRNCKNKSEMTIDLGELGKQTRYACSIGGSPSSSKDCSKFICINTKESIEQEMIEDIGDPSICGAKEPKIAALLWVLHENPKDEDEDSQPTSKESEGTQQGKGIIQWLGQLFK